MKYLSLTLLVMLFSCAEDYVAKPLLISDIVSFDNAADVAIKADGTDKTTIDVTVGSDGEEAVTFTTDQGTFAGTGSSSNQKTITITTVNHKASATLISDLDPQDNVVVTAAVTKDSKTYTAKRMVAFKTARPTSFFITSDKNKVKADFASAATLAITVTRDDNSKVSSGISFTITSEIKSGSVEVDMVPFVKTTDSSNETPLTFVVKSKNDQAGVVTIKITTKDDNDNTLQQTKDIEFGN